MDEDKDTNNLKVAAEADFLLEHATRQWHSIIVDMTSCADSTKDLPDIRISKVE